MRRISQVFLFLLVSSGLLISGCSSPTPMPEVKVEGAALSSLSLTGMTLDVFLSVDNPYPVGITLHSLSFDVYYRDGNEWNYLAHGEQTEIPVNPGTNPVTVPVTIKNADLLGSVLSFAGSREMLLEIRGTVIPDLPGGLAPEIPFTRTVSITR